MTAIIAGTSQKKSWITFDLQNDRVNMSATWMEALMKLMIYEPVMSHVHTLVVMMVV